MVRLIGGEVGVVGDLFVVCIVVIDDTIVGTIADVVIVAVVNVSVGLIEFKEFKDERFVVAPESTEAFEMAL